MRPLREVYFEQLGIDPSSKEDRERRQAALTRAYQLRSFEIEHFWKRATYFWGYQVAIFTAFGLFLSGRAGGFLFLAVPVAAVGFLTALAGLLAGQGSKFWQENWEKHIDMLEDEFEGRLHKTVWLGKTCCHPSVSGVNHVLGWVFVAFWVMAFVGAVALTLATTEANGATQPAWWPAFSWSRLAIAAVGVAFASVLFWRLVLRPVRGETILRNGNDGGGCDSSNPYSPQTPLLVARYNPANESDLS